MTEKSQFSVSHSWNFVVAKRRMLDHHVVLKLVLSLQVTSELSTVLFLLLFITKLLQHILLFIILLNFRLI